MLILHRQPYACSTRRRSLRLTAETVAALAYLAPPGLQASAIALAVELLYVVVGGDLGEVDDLGEVLAEAVGWDTEQLEAGLAFVKSAVRRAGLVHDEAKGEVL